MPLALTPSAATQAPRGRGQAARPVWVALSSAVGGNPDSRLPWSRYRGQRYPRGRAAPGAPCSLRPRSLQPAAHARPRVGPQSPRDVRTGASPLPAFSPSGNPPGPARCCKPTSRARGTPFWRHVARAQLSSPAGSGVCPGDALGLGPGGLSPSPPPSRVSWSGRDAGSGPLPRGRMSGRSEYHCTYNALYYRRLCTAGASNFPFSIAILGSLKVTFAKS